MNSSSDIEIENFRPLALKIASRYKNRGIEWEELKGLAYLGLVKARGVFDPSRGSFATIAMHTVRAEITNTFENYSSRLNLNHAKQSALIEDFPDKEPSALELLIEKRQVISLHKAIDQLPERHKFIIKQRYFRDDVTLRDLADSLRVSYQRVAQIEEAALKQLRKVLNVSCS